MLRGSLRFVHSHAKNNRYLFETSFFYKNRPKTRVFDQKVTLKNMKLGKRVTEFHKNYNSFDKIRVQPQN